MTRATRPGVWHRGLLQWQLDAAGHRVCSAEAGVHSIRGQAGAGRHPRPSSGMAEGSDQRLGQSPGRAHSRGLHGGTRGPDRSWLLGGGDESEEADAWGGKRLELRGLGALLY